MCRGSFAFDNLDIKTDGFAENLSSDLTGIFCKDNILQGNSKNLNYGSLTSNFNLNVPLSKSSNNIYLEGSVGYKKRPNPDLKLTGNISYWIDKRGINFGNIDSSFKLNRTQLANLNIFQKNGIDGFITAAGELKGKISAPEISLNFDVTYPSEFPIAEAAGKIVNCTVIINKIYKKVIPKLDDDFMKKLGIESKEMLEERVASDLERSCNEKSEGSLRKNIGDKLISDNNFEFPKSFLTDEEKRLENEYLARMNEKGIKTEEVDSKTKGVIKESAERNVKLALIFAEISKVENILVDDNEIEQVIASIAKSQNTQISKVKKYYKDNNLMDDVKVKLTDEKVIRFLVSEAKIKEIKPKAVK